ncbi:transcription-repair coupling factor [Candidatus Hydrogenedentota bacterium]
MASNLILNSLSNIEALAELESHIASGETGIRVGGLWGSSRSLFMAALAVCTDRPLLLVAPDRDIAEGIAGDLASALGDERTHYFPSWEVPPGGKISPTTEIVAERMALLTSLISSPVEVLNPVIVTTARALMRHVLPPEYVIDEVAALETGMDHNMADLVARLCEGGYHRTSVVEMRGELSVRGGILDVYSMGGQHPVRIEFFGDEVESIRTFDPLTQRSFDRISETLIMPGTEKDLLTSLRKSGAGPATLFDYLPNDALVVWHEDLGIHEQFKHLERRYRDSGELHSWEHIENEARPFTRISISHLAPSACDDEKCISVSTNSMLSIEGGIGGFCDKLSSWIAQEKFINILCDNEGERELLVNLLKKAGIPSNIIEIDPERLAAGKVGISLGSLTTGFEIPELALAAISRHEIFRRRHRQRKSRFKGGMPLSSYTSLTTGDYVVHNDYGVGRYQGVQHLEDLDGDFLAIEYAAGDKVYVPVTEMGHVHKYIGSEAGSPTLHNLNTAAWNTAKTKAKAAVADMAEDLVKLYAVRRDVQGFSHSADSVWQAELEDAFIHDETPDQSQAIEDIKKDLESDKPMDRLLCGDVGFGKTEVALRAAFKVVQDGRQVAVLAPTTVLAQQHYDTFSSRLAEYPVNVNVLSRFRTQAEQKKVVTAIGKGEVDIIVGTHRLLSKDVKYRELGLVIVDEEQRFGVGHKERLKQIRNEVDVLAMTATPIPRTLHLSLAGIRDITVINTPPENRLPVITRVVKYDADTVCEALEREFARGGQAFFVHNRVKSIYGTAGRLQKLLGDARIAVAHGQMGERELEEVMRDFVDGSVDLLVTTSIIESGLDIPNANTLMIDRADRFGLSDLYQLRGRVGRGDERAYAWFFVPDDTPITDIARKRLKILEEFSALGSGFDVALKDMELRGAGNILGAEQSGHVAQVGFDMYCRMLDEAVRELRNDTPPPGDLPKIEIGLNAFLPDTYVPVSSQKVNLYRQIAESRAPEQLDALAEELVDRFGPMPEEAENLLNLMRLRMLAGEMGIAQIKRDLSSGDIVFNFALDKHLSRDKLVELSAKYRKRLKLVTIPNLQLIHPTRPGPRKYLVGIVSRLLEDMQ